MMSPMATTKKSTTKKSATQRTKKPVAKAAAKTTRAAKTTKKSVSTKVTKATKTTKPAKAAASKVTKSSTGSVLGKLHVVGLVLSAGLAAAAAFLMSNQTYQLVKGLLAKNELATDANTAFVPAVRPVFDLELRWAVVGIMAVSALLTILILTVYKKRYVAAINGRVNGLRWADIAITSALMLEVTALLSGINDILFLKLLAGLVVVTSVLGWIAEKRNVQANRPVKSELVLSVATGILPWVAVLGYALCTYIYGRVTSPWYVYALYVVLLAGFTGYCLTLKSWVYRKTTDFAATERRYLTIGILTKTAFAAVLIAGLLK